MWKKGITKCFIGLELKKYLRFYNIMEKYILELPPWSGGGFWEGLLQTVKRGCKP